MTMLEVQPAEVAAVARRFALEGECTQAQRHGHGRIHETWLVCCDTGRRYVLQRLNADVFGDLEGLMRNVTRISAHLAQRLGASAGPPMRSLRLVPARDGSSWLCDGGWRAWEFVEGTVALERADGPEQAYEAARAFGSFADLLADLPGPPLVETIPGFHDTAARVRALREVAARDPLGRVAGARAELEQALGRAELAERLPELARAGRLRSRIVHNDTKLNNVLFDAVTGRAACVIDLDTVMPGFLAYDFGDLVRSAGNAAPEEGADPRQARLRLPVFEALAQGYLEGAAALLEPADRSSLAFAGPLVSFEVAVRFLTDHLAGDRYFRIARPGQNLARARVQLGLLASMEAQADAMRRILERA